MNINFIIVKAAGGKANFMEDGFGSDIIARLHAGDNSAYNELFEAFRKPLLYFIMAITHDQFESEDIVSETFRKLLGRVQNFDSIVSVRSFLFITAKNDAIDYLRGRKREVNLKRYFENLSEMNEEDIINKFITADLLDRLWERAKDFPESEQIILSLFYMQELTLKEIGDKLGMSEGATKQKKFRILKKLRQLVNREKFLPVLLVIYSVFHS